MHSDDGATGRSLGHLDLDHRLSRRHRDQVRDLAPTWQVGAGGDTLELADPDGPDLVVASLRDVIRAVLTPCGVEASGAVVLETGAGLVTITVSGRRVTSRRLGPGSRDRWGPGRPAVEECRVVRLDERRVRTAHRHEPWIG